jgi:hypothetical protein
MMGGCDADKLMRWDREEAEIFEEVINVERINNVDD